MENNQSLSWLEQRMGLDEMEEWENYRERTESQEEIIKEGLLSVHQRWLSLGTGKF